MNRDYRIVCIVLALGSAVTFGIFSMPALTTTTTQTRTGINQQQFDAAVRQEWEYCQSSAQDADCQCFSQISGTVLTENRPRIRNATYANQTELARSQARESC